MQSHVPSLSERVDRLERQNRRLRWLLLGLPVVALLIGAQAQQAVWKGKTVVAEEFILNDPNGKMRATLMLQKDAPHLFLLDSDGRVRVNLAADSEGNGPALFLVNKEKVVATLRSYKDQGPLFGLFADDEKPILTAGRAPQNGVGYVDFFDGKGNWKGSVGGIHLK